jgi:hypothetical protein
MLCISTPNSVRPHLQLYKVVALLQLLPQPLRHKLRRQQLLRRRTHVVMVVRTVPAGVPVTATIPSHSIDGSVATLVLC